MSRLPFPLSVLDMHMILLAKTRSGKSSIMRLMAETLLDKKLPVVIISPKDDWWGIRSSADGKSNGYPVVLFGGEHADHPISAHSGGVLGKLLATGNRPASISLYGMSVADRTRFFRDFAEAFFQNARGKRWLFIDEVHNFAPQAKLRDPLSTDMLHWANRLANEGAGLGITLVSASQRPQKVHKDFTGAHETLFAMKVIQKRDRDASKEWMDGHNAEIGKEIVQTLAHLKRGETWVWSPEEDFGPKRIQFPLFSTYDSFKPQAARRHRLRGWASVDQEKLGPQLEAVAAEKKANDPTELKKTIRELEIDNKRLAGEVANYKTLAERTVLPSRETIGKAEERGYGRGYRDACKDTAAFDRFIEKIRFDDVVRSIKHIELAVRKPTPAAPAPTFVAPKPAPREQTLVKQQRAVIESDADAALPKGERAILTAVVQFGECDRPQISAIVGYGQSTRDSYIKRLRTKNYVAIGGGKVSATPEGIAALGPYERLPSGTALQAWWLGRLPVGEAKVFTAVLAAYPEGLRRDVISEQSGYGQSTRDSYIKRLVTKKLVENKSGSVRATPHLFD